MNLKTSAWQWIGLWLLLVGPVLADPRIARIELTDGSMIRGEITALVNGSYAIESPTLGRIQVRQDQVSAIHYDSGSSNTAAAGAGAANLADLQKSLVGDPAILSMIQQLHNDPQIQAIISDPALQRAIQAGDIGALMADPRFLKLLDHPDIKAISRQVTPQQ